MGVHLGQTCDLRIRPVALSPCFLKVTFESGYPKFHGVYLLHVVRLRLFEFFYDEFVFSNFSITVSEVSLSVVKVVIYVDFSSLSFIQSSLNPMTLSSFLLKLLAELAALKVAMLKLVLTDY